MSGSFDKRQHTNLQYFHAWLEMLEALPLMHDVSECLDSVD